MTLVWQTANFVSTFRRSKKPLIRLIRDNVSALNKLTSIITLTIIILAIFYIIMCYENVRNEFCW